MDYSEEEWKPARGFEQFFVASSLGRIKRIRHKDGTPADRVLSPWMSANGYLMIELRPGGKAVKNSVHAIVAEAFHGPRPAGYEVNHIDGIKYNNLASNLQFVTHGQNMRHAHAMGLMRSGKGLMGDWHRVKHNFFPVQSTDRYKQRLSDKLIREICESSSTDSCAGVARRLGINRRTVERYRREKKGEAWNRFVLEATSGNAALDAEGVSDMVRKLQRIPMHLKDVQKLADLLLPILRFR